MHIKSLFVHDNQIILSEPELITPAKQKKLREHKSNFTYYAPEMKEIINLPHSFFKLDADKFDVWSFGFVLHRVLTREVPLFDAIRKPILTKGLSPGMEELISRCLALTPFLRPKWDELDLNKLPSKPAPRK